MFRAAWQFHLFRDPAGAVALDKDLVCSGRCDGSIYRHICHPDGLGSSGYTAVVPSLHFILFLSPCLVF